MINSKDYIFAYSCFAYLLFTIADSCTKISATEISGYKVILLSSGYTIILGIIYLTTTRKGLKTLKTKHPVVHSVRACLSATSYILIVEALPRIPLPLFYCLAFTLPLWACLSGLIFNRERIFNMQIAGIAIGFIGVLVALQPNPSDLGPSCLFVILGMIFLAISSVMGKWISQDEDPFTLGFYPRLASFVMFLPLLREIFSDSISFSIHLLILGSALLSGIALVIIGRAFQVERAAVIAPAQYSQIIWSSILAYLIWSETPTLMTFIGNCIIVLGGYIVIKGHVASPE
jgi:drug/metabolite transporter (DMT)-like permease